MDRDILGISQPMLERPANDIDFGCQALEFLNHWVGFHVQLQHLATFFVSFQTHT